MLRFCASYKLWSDPKFCAPWRERAEAEAKGGDNRRHGWSANNRTRKSITHHEQCAGCPGLEALDAPQRETPEMLRNE